MGKLIIGEFITLDGVIQAPGGADEDRDGDFPYGGWTRPFWHDDLGVYFTETMKDCSAFLLGRKTWQTHGAAFEPLPPGDFFGDIMNGMRKYVVSTTLTSTSLWRNSILLGKDLVAEVKRIKSAEAKAIYLDGSSVLAHTLIERDLVDELSLLQYPILLGTGKRLFPGGVRRNFELVETQSFPTGVVLHRYARSE
jgi:dihydrofolate reductase